MERAKGLRVYATAVPGWVVGVFAALIWAGPAHATHYPPGWKCYECHAVSASKIVPGTHLIKQSQKTVDLGITSTDPTIRCLFCHEAFLSAENPDGLPRDRMKGVDQHFGSGALSKHPVDVTRSTFVQDPAAFDCLDCHTVTGLDTGADPANPNIHGVDASQALLPVNQTLIGAPADTSDAEISTKTCQNANCHDADGGTANGYTAPPGHSASNAKISLNDVAVVSGSADADASGQIYCTKCHASHGSLDGEVLLSLVNSSGHNGQAPTNRTVALDECDVCHTKDENGGLTDNFYAYGHGRILGGGCTACHELRHDTDGDHVFDPAPRLKLTQDTTAGTSTFGTSFYSNCRACHKTHAAHTPTPASGGDPGTGRSAGCLDCHDPHGTTAADSTFQNDTMIRRTIAGEEVQLPGDLAAIGPPPPDGSGDTYDGDWFNPGGGSPAVETGVCDNVACHSVLTANLQTDHRGGTLGDTSCATGTGCHATHLEAGRQGKLLGAASCSTCHGSEATGQYWPSGANVAGDDTTPNNSGAHRAHIAWLADYVYGYRDDPSTPDVDEGIDALLSDDAQGTAHDKQRYLCEFCHAAFQNDDDHMATYPAEVFDATVGGGARRFARQYWNSGTLSNPVYADDPDASYSPLNRRCSNVDCHDTGGPGADWYVDPSTLSCGSCHGGITSHLKRDPGGGDMGCPTCHPGGSSYPRRHSTNGSPNVVEIPLPPVEWDNPGTSTTESWNMQTRMGLHYRVHLGGEWTTGSTEAEICWNCHGTDDAVNEWGYNTDTNGTSWPVVQIPDVSGGTGGSYNYGWLYSDTGWTALTPYWVNTNDPAQGMYRKDGYQHDPNTNPSYRLSRRITSVHSVDFTVGADPGSSVAMNVDANGNVIRDATQVLEPRSAIRCSYCHDVHDLNKASNDAQSGPPHLRGSWMGNPYPPDMPPLSGYSYPTTGGPGPLSVGNRFSTSGPRGDGQFSEPVPRLWGDATSRAKGGYFIDANSGRPTDDPAYDTLGEVAGLCTLCHGTDVDNMDYYTGSSLWRSDQVNGHSNSTLGGTGANAVDLFDARRTTGNWLYMAHQDGVNVWRYGRQSGARSSAPFRADFSSFRPARNSGQYAPPRNTGWYGGTAGSTTKGAQYSTWYSAGGVGTDGVNATAHKFPCSKCHSPHATGLPALLITNCLDKDVSNWSAAGGAANPSVQQANNCHRKESTGTGWHRLAPQQ